MTVSYRLLILQIESGSIPLTRGECREWQDCRLTSCRFNLRHERHHSEKTQGHGEIPEGEWCALNVADRGDHLLGEVAALLGITPEAVRQNELRALRKLKKAAKRLEHAGPEPRRDHWSDLEVTGEG